MQDLQYLDNETCWLVKELKSYIAQEADFLPRETGLNIMESAAEVGIAIPLTQFYILYLPFSSVLMWYLTFIFRITMESLQNAEMPKLKTCGA